MKKKTPIIIIAVILSIVLIAGILCILFPENSLSLALWSKFKVENSQNDPKTVSISTDVVDIKGTVSDTETKIIDKCFEYYEKYQETALPDDKQQLIEINDTIADAFENDLFYKGLEQSKFQKDMEANESYAENRKEGGYDKSCFYINYYRQLSIIRMRALLLLDEYDEFFEVLKDSINRISFPIPIFAGGNMYIKFSYDTGITDSPERLRAIADSFEKLLDLCEIPEDEYYVYSEYRSFVVLEDEFSESEKNDLKDRYTANYNLPEVQKLNESPNYFKGFASSELNSDKEFIN